MRKMCEGPRRSGVVWLLLAAAVVLVAVVYYRVVWGGVANLVVALDHCRELYCDFTRQYYPTGQEILRSGQPSNGYFYSSFFALLLAPFGRMAPEQAVGWWSVVQLVGLLLLLIPAADFYRQSRAAALLYVALLAFSMPVLHNLKWGQVSTLMTGCVFAALYLNTRGRWRGAAVVLGFAAAIKYYVAVFAWVWLVRRAWRFLIALAVVAAVCWLLLPALALGPDGNWAFYRTVSERMTHALATWLPEDINSQYLPSVVGRWLGTTSGRTVWQFTGYGLFALNALAVARYLRRQEASWAVDAWAYGLLFLALPFAINTSWPHYFVYLPFVQVLLWLRLRQADGRAGQWRTRLQWALLIASIILASMPFFQLIGDWRLYSRAGVLFVANLCVLVAAHVDCPAATPPPLPRTGEMI